jgi:hypothetical protein
VTLEREITVKCVAFPDTTDNLVKQNPAYATVCIVERAIVIQVLAKAFSSVILVIGFVEPPFFYDTFQVNHDLPP